MTDARRLALTLLAALAARSAAAQATDTTRTRALGEAVVSGAASAGPGVVWVDVGGIRARDPVALADVARLIPSATAATNSRGETLVALRGAGERQTAVLLDGAPLTVPWDRRLDLALVPAGVVGSLDVVRGPASLVWGPNAAGGALDLVPRALPADGTAADAWASAGVPASGLLAATALVRRGAWSGLAAVDAAARRGAALAAALPFSQDAGTLRTNSDRRAASALLRLVHAPVRGVHVAATLLHMDARQGVAPEGHLDPAAERVRFWRIPTWRHTTAVVRARVPAGAADVDATAWAGAFEQTTETFPDATYGVPDGGQRDRDRSAGARLVASVRVRGTTLRGIAWGSAAAHRETEGDRDERFRAAEGRLAVEAERRLGAATALAGVGVDTFRPLRADGRDVGGAFAVPAAVARIEAPLRTPWGRATLHAGVARGGRTPTMRELFGEALGRFALNPDLRAEATSQAEAGVRADGPWAAVHATAFARRTTGTIEPEALPDGRRRRVNLGSSRAIGVEADVALRLGPAVRLDASGTLMHLAATDGTGRSTRLAERPAVLGRLALTAQPRRGLGWAVEALATGPAVSLGPDGDVRLPASLVLNARVGYAWERPGGSAEAFVRVDNAADALVLPQAGLPAPGRELRVGVRWAGRGQSP